MTTRLISLAVLATLLWSGAAAGQQYISVPLNGSWVNDITPDGTVVVGTWFGGGFYWRWQEDPAPVDIGGMSATGVSDDGTYITGNIQDMGTQTAGRWSEATGWVSLGGVDTCGSTSSAYDISADGTQCVGLAWDGCNGRGYLWTEGVGMQLLAELGNGTNRCSAIAGDGSTMGGFAQGSFNRTPALWNPDLTGQVYDIDLLGEVYGFNEDGSITLGTINGDAYYETQEDGITFIGSINPNWEGIPEDVTQDGTTIVGFDVFQTARQAWVWREVGGMVTLNSLMTSLGVQDLPSFLVCRAVSEDGNIIVGGYSEPGVFNGGFIVTLTDVLGTWTDLRNGLAGTQGVPALAGDGSLVAGTNTTIELNGGVPSGTAALVLGLSQINAAFKQGVMVPSLDVILVGLPLDGSGGLAFQFDWPSGLPSGTSFYWQYWIPDVAGPAGFAASNGLQSTTP